ncbi:MAG: hypothetical protein Q9165_004942 [Trypethelium subeluteriae]
MTDSTNIVITGANRGIGRALVVAFLARKNTTVVAGVRDPAAAASASQASLAPADGSRIIVLKIDSTADTDANEAAQQLSSTHGITKLDIVVANAGIGDTAEPVLSSPPDAIRRHIDVNVIGVLTLFQAVEPLLHQAAAPKFRTMSSNLGSIGLMEYVPGPWLAYGVSKAGLNFLTRKIHFENEWLTAEVLSPGWVQTDMGAFAAKAIGMEGAPVTMQDSIQGVMKAIDEASREKTSGAFISHEGQSVPW